MDQIKFPEDTPVTVSRPLAFPLPEKITDILAAFLAKYPQVRRACLLQIVYPRKLDPRVGDSPCLTCVVDIERDPDNATFSKICEASQSVVDGKTGEWSFLDFLPFDAVPEVEQIAPPFYVRKA